MVHANAALGGRVVGDVADHGILASDERRVLAGGEGPRRAADAGIALQVIGRAVAFAPFGCLDVLTETSLD